MRRYLVLVTGGACAKYLVLGGGVVAFMMAYVSATQEHDPLVRYAVIDAMPAAMVVVHVAARVGLLEPFDHVE